MSPYRRNVLLGATVLCALCVLAWMILKFGGNVASIFAQATIDVEFITLRADGVADGSPVTYLGLESGHVTRVWLDEDRKHVHFIAAVNQSPALPGNVRGVIKTTSLLGAGSSVTLVTEGGPPSETLQPNQKIQAEFIGLGDVLPTQFGDLASEMASTIKQLRDSGLINDLDAQVKNAGRLISAMHDVVGDAGTQSDLKQSISNIKQVTESAKSLASKLDKLADDVQKTSTTANETLAKAGTNIDTLSRQMGERLTQIAKLLEQFQSVADKVNRGEGTAGALVNDPKLYQSLVDTSRDLNETIKDFKRLVEQWEQEGVTLKLK